jgi:hypothetical protein
MSMKAHRGKGTGVHYSNGNYNAQWEAWIRRNPNASAAQVIDHLNEMTTEPFGVFFDNPFPH